MSDILPLESPSTKKKNGKKGSQKRIYPFSEKKGDEKPDWSVIKKKKLELKITRKKKESSIYELSSEAKSLWELVRREDCPKDQRPQLVSKLYELLKSNFSKVVFCHDVTRVIQSLLKFGTPDIRLAITKELKELVIPMARSKYSKFFVLKALKYGPQEARRIIVGAFLGSVVNCIKHKHTAPVLDYAYSEWANGVEKQKIQQEFYGPEYRIFKDETVYSLEDILQKYPEKKEKTLAFMKSCLSNIIDKNRIQPKLVHFILRQFLTHCDPKDRTAIIQSIRDQLQPVLFSKDGAKVGMMCLWHGTPKDKKIIMKSFKGHVTEIATKEHSYMVLLALFDCVDDTVLLSKLVLTEIIEKLKVIIKTECGRKVIQYLVQPRLPMYFHPSIVSVLKEGDTNSMSKKSSNMRRSEILKAVSEPFLEAVAKEPLKWTKSSSVCLVTLAVLCSCTGSKLKETFQEVARFVTDDDMGKTGLVELGGINFFLKKLIKNDSNRIVEGEVTFSASLVEELSSEVINLWLKYNRGAYILVWLMESNIPSVVSTLKQKLLTVKQQIEELKTQGAEILLTKLA